LRLVKLYRGIIKKIIKIYLRLQSQSYSSLLVLKLDLEEANHQLENLIEKVSQGEKVIIVDNKGESFQILPLKARKKRPK
jgi:hypothetical protein